MIMIPAEHYELLQGSLEILMKRDYPQTFEKTIKLSQQYANNKRWVQGHSPDHIVKERLTMKELTVATLYDRGWTALDIAQHMELSERTVRNYINTIYAKLGITDRKALGQYMNE